jgi:actin-related protein 5
MTDKLTQTQIEEAPSFPLLDVPDAELDPEQLKEKKRQRMLKAGYDTRVKLKAEKQAEKERLVRCAELLDVRVWADAGW